MVPGEESEDNFGVLNIIFFAYVRDDDDDNNNNTNNNKTVYYCSNNKYKVMCVCFYDRVDVVVVGVRF